jgi:glycosyltransferase involved in cell wall biosynthesis
MSDRGRICFYAPYLYPVAVKSPVKVAGGTEIRQWALARGLAQRGFDVTVVTCDFGQPPVSLHRGVRLLRTYSLEAGIPGLRFAYPRLWKAMRTLHGASADVYVANGAGIPTGWAYDVARARGSRFAFLAASDYDALYSLPFVTKRRDRWWYLRALRGADARVAQTELQQALFRDNFGIETQVIANPVEPPLRPVDAGMNDTVLWLSTYKPHKRPEWFTDLARRLPHLRFVMVGGLPDFGESRGSWNDARRAATSCPNLEVHGFVDHDRIGELLSQAAIFVHTSPAEGFPMTLLETWSYGVPCVTTVDPGGTVLKHGIGDFVNSRDELVEAVERNMADPARRTRLGARARAYVEQYHGPDRTYEPLAALLDDLINKR